MEVLNPFWTILWIVNPNKLRSKVCKVCLDPDPDAFWTNDFRVKEAYNNAIQFSVNITNINFAYIHELLVWIENELMLSSCLNKGDFNFLDRHGLQTMLWRKGNYWNSVKECSRWKQIRDLATFKMLKIFLSIWARACVVVDYLYRWEE